MKWLLFISLFTINNCLSQDKIPSKSIVAVDKMNVVYRGIANPISIAVPGAKSFKVSGLGVVETEIIGKYTLSPGAGKEIIVKIEAIMQDDSVVIEEKIFRIKNIGSLKAFLDGRNCNKCILEFSKKEIETTKIELRIEDFLQDVKFTLESFTVNLPNKKSIHITGNQLNEIALKEIMKLKVGSIFILGNFRQSNPNNFCLAGINSVKIMIVEEKKMEGY